MMNFEQILLDHFGHFHAYGRRTIKFEVKDEQHEVFIKNHKPVAESHKFREIFWFWLIYVLLLSQCTVFVLLLSQF